MVLSVSWFMVLESALEGPKTRTRAVPRVRYDTGMKIPASLLCLLATITTPAVADDALSTMPPDDASAIGRIFPGVVLGPSDKKTLDVEKGWFSPDAVELVYVKPTDESKRVSWKVIPTNRGPGEDKALDPDDAKGKGWAVDLPTDVVRYYVPTDDSGLEGPIDLAKSYSYVIRLDPAEPLIDPALAKGGDAQRKISVKISDVGSPQDVQYGGTVTCTSTDLGVWRVKVPHGEHHARLVKIHYAGGIGPASVSATNYYFLVPGLGPVAYSDDRSISAFIFYNNDSDRSGVLKEVRKSTGR